MTAPEPRVEDKLDRIINLLETKIVDHEKRIGTLEKKHTIAGAVAGAIASVAVAVIAALAGCSGGCAYADPRPADMSRPAEYDIARAATAPVEIDGRLNGTGWYVADLDGALAGSSLVVTAGHVCEDTGVHSVGGAPALVVVDRIDPDVCVLWALGPAPAVLRLADESPRAGTEVMYHGFPSGIRGTYWGIVEGRAADGTVAVSVAGYYGASGSAVLARGEVAGMLVMGNMFFTNQVWLTPMEDIRSAVIVARDVLETLPAVELMEAL